MQTCAPAWRQSKLWVFILHWWGRRWPRLCRTSIFLHPVTALQRSCSGANAVGTIPCLDWAACSLPPSPFLAGGCFGFTAWRGSALIPPDLPPCLLCTAQIVQRICADISWVPRPHQCRDTGGQSETPVRLVHHLRELCLLTRHCPVLNLSHSLVMVMIIIIITTIIVYFLATSSFSSNKPTLGCGCLGKVSQRGCFHPHL